MKKPYVREWENDTIKPEDNYPRSSRKTRTRLSAETGGAHGVRDLAMLEPAIARRQTEQEQEDHDQAIDERTEDVAVQVEEVIFFGRGVMRTANRASGTALWTKSRKK
jgi:hypothetical protein